MRAGTGQLIDQPVVVGAWLEERAEKQNSIASNANKLMLGGFWNKSANTIEPINQRNVFEIYFLE
jgi:hypothetical protein